MKNRNTIIFVLLLFTLAISITLTSCSPSASAVFAFGDSTLDAGMNNGLKTLMRCDHLPYGKDLPDHVPTGRFSNGKVATDYLASNLGIKELLPAYLDPNLTIHDLRTGVSFASGGSGIDDETVLLTQVYTLEKQLKFFDQAMRKMRRSVGNREANEIVENAVFVISTGTNDMLVNLFDLPITPRKLEFPLPGQYIDFLLGGLRNFIEALYQRGARRIMVAGLPPIGCLPIQQTLRGIFHLSPQRICDRSQNTECEHYNSKLQTLLSSLQTSLSGSRIAYFDTYTPMTDMFDHPAKHGLVQTHQGCCGTGLVEMGPVCGELSPTCPDPSKYLFWDAVHPTQAANFILAEYCRTNVLPDLIA